MSNLRIYHNPRCSKSRQTLQIIEQQGLQPEIIEYLKTPPSQKDISEILALLDFDSARQLMRKNEDEYKQLSLSALDLSEEELIAALCQSPKLIERPIVVNGDKAIIGRPPENVLNIL
ncbi:MAG: arsenate reductase [Paraglaciecola sp.]|jgi:arsenate reductase